MPILTAGVDVISGKNPFTTLAREASASSVGLVITVAIADFDAAPVVGDYVSATGETPVPQIPEDYHCLVPQAAVMRCLAAANDVKGMQTAGAVFSEMMTTLRKRSMRRVSSNPRKLVGASRALNALRGF